MHFQKRSGRLGYALGTISISSYIDKYGIKILYASLEYFLHFVEEHGFLYAFSICRSAEDVVDDCIFVIVIEELY